MERVEGISAIKSGKRGLGKAVTLKKGQRECEKNSSKVKGGSIRGSRKKENSSARGIA